MIIQLLLSIVVNVLNILTAWLPTVDVLPLGMDTIVSTAFGYFKTFSSLFPPLLIVWTAFLWYMTFRIILLSLKLLRIIR